MTAMSDSSRLMFRSRHIYVLTAGLVNLMLGLYLQRQAAGWSRIIQAIGSAFLMAAPVLLILAFIIEPLHGLQAELGWSHSGLYALFAGSMAHLVCGTAAPAKSIKR
jgi:hypothetical protein